MTLKIKLLVGLLALALVLGMGTSIYFVGRAHEETAQKSAVAVTYKKEVAKNADIDKQANRMAEPDLDRALSHWVQ